VKLDRKNISTLVDSGRTLDFICEELGLEHMSVMLENIPCPECDQDREGWNWIRLDELAEHLPNTNALHCKLKWRKGEGICGELVTGSLLDYLLYLLAGECPDNLTPVKKKVAKRKIAKKAAKKKTAKRR
jgi:hypothetical protein